MSLAACRQRKTQPPGTRRTGEYFWSGIGFGIDMSMEIYGVTAAEGEELGLLCEQTIRELERAFSLYQENSELSVLNRERTLSSPSAVFNELLGKAAGLSARTLGYYQPAVHGAWLWLGRQDGAHDPAGDSDWLAQCAACDLKFLETSADGSVRLVNALTMLSMNAIVQGFLADMMAARLREAGVSSALLHLGESYAIGKHPEGRLWKLAVTGTPENGETGIIGHVEFEEAGLAVSGQDTTRLLIDPVAAVVRRQASVVAVVSSEGAAVADAYATAFAVAPEEKWPALAGTMRNPGSQVHIWIGNQLRFTV